MRKKINYKDYSTLQQLVEAVRAEGLASNSTEARNYIYQLIPQEKDFQKKIMLYFRELQKNGVPIFYWKAHSGGYQRGGVPDICSVINGRFYGWEVKRPLVGKVSNIQRDAIRGIEKAGGKAYVVCYVDDVEKVLKDNEVI